MIFTIVIWLLVWGALFTDIDNLVSRPDWLTNPLWIFQGIRALLPIIALYISLMWIFVGKSKFPSLRTPPGLFFYYSLVGLATSLFSPDVMTSLYWGLLFLSTVLATWILYMREDSLLSLQTVSYVNHATVIVIFLVIFSKVARLGFGARGQQFYELPFGLGRMTANGVGRFALMAAIIAGVHFFFNKKNIRFAWLILCLFGIYMIMFTQSRTSLLGLGVASMLFVLIMGFRWYYVLMGPFIALVLWQAGFKGRAGGQIDILMQLSGRESTWAEAISLIKQSPFLGWGFHSDRIMLDCQHIHNSYVHAAIQSGILGLVFFVLAITSIWILFLKTNIFKKLRYYDGEDKPLLIINILLIGFFSARSLFESTAAFYGVDLLIFLPAIVYVYNWMQVQRQEDGDSQTSVTEYIRGQGSSLRPYNF